MQFDEIPQLPEIDQDDYGEEDQEFVFEEFRRSQRKIMFYEAEDGQFRCLFSKLDHVFYAEFAAVLSRPGKLHEDVYTFLKLCLEGVRLLKQCSKKGLETAIKVEKYLKSKTNEG